MYLDKLGSLPTKPSMPFSGNWAWGPRKGRLVALTRVRIVLEGARETNTEYRKLLIYFV